MREYVRMALLALSLGLGGAAALACAANAAEATSPAPADSIKKVAWGKADGQPVSLYTLTNKHGMVAKITNYGGIVTELHTPDRNGQMGDVVLGFDNLAQYLKGDPYFGAIVGRFGNRIAKGTFKLDGKTYHLPINNGPNSLHGGTKGFDKRVWKATPHMTANGPALTLAYLSKNGEEGYPGDLHTTVTYTLTNDNALRIEYTATTDKDTPLNLTNHSYFNLAGSGDILDTDMTIAADRYTPVDANMIPTGKIVSVKGTPLDFTTPHKIGERIGQMTETKGYDHNFVLNSGGGKLAFAARAHDPLTGRVMEVYTTQPGVQFYTGNFLDGTLTGKRGEVYRQHDAFCLETQHFPDSPNHPNFPSSILHPGQTYHQVTVYKFSAR